MVPYQIPTVALLAPIFPPHAPLFCVLPHEMMNKSSHSDDKMKAIARGQEPARNDAEGESRAGGADGSPSAAVGMGGTMPDDGDDPTSDATATVAAAAASKSEARAVDGPAPSASSEEEKEAAAAAAARSDDGRVEQRRALGEGGAYEGRGSSGDDASTDMDKARRGREGEGAPGQDGGEGVAQEKAAVAREQEEEGKIEPMIE